jgi:DNA-binding SARP family transcriptional activator
VADVSDSGGGRVREVAASPGLVRDRLMARLADPAAFRVGWIVAPAGTGKSRLLAHVVAAFPGSAVLCEMPDPVPRSEAALAAWLAERLRAADAVAPGRPGGAGLEDLLSAGRQQEDPVLLAIDDAHLLEGTEAESSLDGLVTRLPPAWRLIVASRMNLAVDLTRLRVSGQVVDIGPEDLRFRTWEVEELFRHVYRDPLLPEDVAVLTRRTAGWAAYLQLFYLATNHRSSTERRVVLDSLRQRTRLVSEYLARHVLTGLVPELQDFLVRTSALRRSTGRICDEFLGWAGGSDALLAELERRQLFTERQADDSYRYHAVLVAHLDSELIARLGLEAAREEHRRAGRILEREGWTEEALAAYVRSEDWESVGRLAVRSDAVSALLDDAWVDALPAAVLESDPLLLMARARSQFGRGAWAEASATLRLAETVAGSAEMASRCWMQREQILAWVEPDRAAPRDWLGTLRTAIKRRPAAARAHAATLPGVTGRFAEGVAAWLDGDAPGAARLLRVVRDHPDCPPVLVGVASLLDLSLQVAQGREADRDEVGRVREEVERSGPVWLARILAACLPAADQVGGAADAAEREALVAACERVGDRWGAAAITAVDGLRRLAQGQPDSEAVLGAAAEQFRALGAGVLAALAWAHASLAAAAAGRPPAAAVASTRALGIPLEVPWAVALADLAEVAAGLGAPVAGLRHPAGGWVWHRRLLDRRPALSPADPSRPEAAPELTRAGPDGGSGAPAEGGSGPHVAPGGGGEVVPATAVLRALGGFRLEVTGRGLDLASLKPMERALLFLLASAPGEPRHRESLLSSLWPDADPEAGRHRLQVAVSALRRLVGRDGEGRDVIARSGDAYRLSLPAGARVDIWDFGQAAERAARARAAGDHEAERAALEDAVSAYGGELIPEAGPADWVVGPRRNLATRYADLTARLAELLLVDDPRRAGRVARAGLAVERYRDDLWKALVEAAERCGHHAEAEAARREYEAVLAELGV